MSSVSRRTVLTVGLGALAFAAPTAVAFAETSLDDATGASTLPIRSQFASSLGKVFTATTDAGAFALTLAEIHDLPPVTAADDENRFGLVFTSRHLSFTEGIVTLRRVGVPTSTLFVSSIGPVTRTQSLQALIIRQA